MLSEEPRVIATEDLSNAVANTSNLHEENGTIYIVSTWLNGQIFAGAEIKTLHDCISLIEHSQSVKTSMTPVTCISI